MVNAKFELKGENILEPISQFLRSYYHDAYESIYKDGFIRVYEDYSFLNGNDIMVCIRLDSTQAYTGVVVVEIISGGGSSSLFLSAQFGSESRRIKHFRKRLEECCLEQGIEMNEI